MYCRSSVEMHRWSAGVLLVRSIHRINVIVDVIPKQHARLQVLDNLRQVRLIRITTVNKKLRYREEHSASVVLS